MCVIHKTAIMATLSHPGWPPPRTLRRGEVCTFLESLRRGGGRFQVPTGRVPGELGIFVVSSTITAITAYHRHDCISLHITL